MKNKGWLLFWLLTLAILVYGVSTEVHSRIGARPQVYRVSPAGALKAPVLVLEIPGLFDPEPDELPEEAADPEEPEGLEETEEDEDPEEERKERRSSRTREEPADELEILQDILELLETMYQLFLFLLSCGVCYIILRIVYPLFMYR